MVDSQIDSSVVVHGRMQDLPREANYFFEGGWVLARGVRGHASPKKKFELCNLVRFGAYFHKFFTFKKSKNIIFLQK